MIAFNLNYPFGTKLETLQSPCSCLNIEPDEVEWFLPKRLETGVCSEIGAGGSTLESGKLLDNCVDRISRDIHGQGLPKCQEGFQFS